MSSVHLRPVSLNNVDAVLELSLLEDQQELVAPNTKSLAQAYADPRLVPLAIYDDAALGVEEPAPELLVGFAMYGVLEGVGYIVRLMIDSRYQRRGYGRAAMAEVVRRLRMTPEVEVIGTSCRKVNVAAAQLYSSLGFVPWTPPWEPSERELYLKLVD